MAYFITAILLIFIAEQICVRIAGVDFKCLPSWSKEVWRWLCKGRDIFGGAFVIIACIVICGLVDWDNKAFIVAGCVLQFAGIIQAIISLLDVRKYFNHPRLLHILKQWLEAYPEIKKLPDVTTVSAIIEVTGSCHASGRVGPADIDQAKPLDEKVNLLINKMELLTKIVFEELHPSIGQLKDGLNNVSTDMKKEIEAKTNEINNGLEQLHVGDFTPTLIGLVWIAAGTIMGAIGSYG